MILYHGWLVGYEQIFIFIFCSSSCLVFLFSVLNWCIPSYPKCSSTLYPSQTDQSPASLRMKQRFKNTLGENKDVWREEALRSFREDLSHFMCEVQSNPIQDLSLN